MGHPVLEIKNLSKKYKNVQALKRLSLHVEPGTIFGILGPNGSGKTTTLGILLGVINASGGQFSWFGNGVANENRRRIGALLETPNFYPYLSAERNLKIVAKIKQINSPEQRITSVLKTVNLSERKKDKFKTYSLGMKQRLAIASALLNDPEVLVLDEPTNGLDPQGIAEIRSIILKIAKEGKTILLASHQLDEVEKVCTDVAILKKGTVIHQGDAGNLVAQSRQIFLSAENVKALKNVLSGIENVSIHSEKEKGILLDINEDITPAKLNKALFEKGIALSKLVEVRKSLEDQFLEITKE